MGAATGDRPGVNFLNDFSVAAIDLAAGMARERRADDIIVCSLHWGPSWGYNLPSHQRSFARGLIDCVGIDIVFGHSSHHLKACAVGAISFSRPLLLPADPAPIRNSARLRPWVS